MSAYGVLLLNLGSPNSPSVLDMRRYLSEFLMDKRVLDVSYLIRLCIVYFGNFAQPARTGCRGISQNLVEGWFAVD
jgi:protoheme ferro-lyase